MEEQTPHDPYNRRSLHEMAAGYEKKYKSKEGMEWLVKMATSRWVRRKTRKAAGQMLHEAQQLRWRMYLAATELQEWRLKVGGANYSAPGGQFQDMVETGLRNITGEPLRITDDDYYPRT